MKSSPAFPSLSYSVKERRCRPRFAIYGRAAIRVLGEGRIQDGRVIGISRSGALLETSRLEIGTNCYYPSGRSSAKSDLPLKQVLAGRAT